MSLIETYQSRKSLLAEKLISKGVQASATDGLTTLINKVGDIHVLQCFASNSVSQVNDSVMLYAVYTPGSGSCSGKTIEFLKVVDGGYSVLGTGVTDDNGVARCEYTCVGQGLLNIVVACDNRMVQSETYEVLDATFLDVGTSSNHNDNYFYPAVYTRDFTRGESNTSIDLQDTSGGSVTYSVGTGMCFEMDLDEVTTYCQVNVVRTETGKSASYHGQNYTSACKVRIEVLPSQTIFKQIVNGVETTLQTINNSTNNTMRIYFPRTNNTNAKFKFKNFIIYQI